MTRPQPRSLGREQSGAIMVMGVFMAALMVGFIYYVKGIGDAIVFSERLQDAADSAAFSAATVHARGMNLIVLINITMVAVLAVVTAARLVAIIASLAIFMSPNPGGLDTVLEKARGHHTELVRPLFSVLRAANTAANAMSTAIPLAAEARAMGTAGTAFTPEVEVVFSYPGFGRMPVAGSSIGILTDRAGVAALPLVLRVFPPYPAAQQYIATRGMAQLQQDAIDEAQAVMVIIESPSALAGMVPHGLVEGAEMGGEDFQLRVVTGGTYEFALSEQGVKIASWGETETRGENESQLAKLSHIALAQSEFYFDGDLPASEWMWNQRWKARLRRWRVEAPGSYPCIEQSVYCDALDEMFQRGLNRAVVH